MSKKETRTAFLRLSQLWKNNFQENSGLGIITMRSMRTWLNSTPDTTPPISVRSSVRKGENLCIDLTLTIQEAAEGVRKELLLQKMVKCGVCNGTRSHNAVPPTRCWTCYGKGVVITKNGPYIEEDVCFKCKGSGVTIKKKCTNCEGVGLTLQNVYEKIKIPSTEADDFTIEFDHKGHQSVNSMAGKLIVKVKVLTHEIFTRKKLDVHSSVGIPYHVGVLGGEVIVETLTGNECITITPHMQHHSIHKLAKQGFRCPSTGIRGDHYISFYLKAPIILSDEEKTLYELLTSID